MKLWQKVSLLGVCVLLAVVIVSSALLLAYTRDSILSLNTEQARARQASLITSFTEMARYYLGDEESPVVKKSGVKYCFQRFADETSVLMRDGEVLHSYVIFDPAEYLPLAQASDPPPAGDPPSVSDSPSAGDPPSVSDSPSAGDLPSEQAGDPPPASEPQSVLKEVYDRNVLIVGSPVVLLGDRYAVYTVMDITGAYNDIAKLTWRFAAIAAASIIAGAILIVLLVRGATKPLMALKKITRRIAVGEYGQRADIRTSDEIGELAADFNVMAEAVQSRIAQLEDTAQRQQLFIGGLTHELKTPMASMIIHTDTLLTTDLNSDEAKNSLIHLHEQCRWMEQLSQKLLKLITLEQEIQVQPEDIEALFADVRDSMAETLSERNTPLTIDCDAEKTAMDYDLMKSLIINLVDNASKASKPGRAITLRARGNAIEVSDNGAGIPPEDLARVTDAFYTVDRSRSKQTGGSGLGLALAKRIADAHGAELVIESEPAAGTTVRIVFGEGGRR